MSDNNSIEIQLSKTKITFLFVASLAFAALGIWFVISPGSFEKRIHGGFAVLMVAGGIGILFFGFCAFFLAKKLLDKTPGVIIDRNGIIDNSSFIAAGFIPWSDIASVKIETIVNQKLLMLVLKNPEHYINKEKKWLVRRAMQMNYKWYGSSVNISANGLKCDLSTLEQLIRKGLKNSRV